MLIFWPQRLIYLAVPKTGSTAIESVLRPYADVAFNNPPRLKHAKAGTMRKFKKLFSPLNPAEFEQVAVMRDPLEWLGSWYRYRSRPVLNGTTNSTANITFEEFVEAVICKDPPPFAHIGSQFRFLCADKEAPVPDRIYPYTRVNEVFTYFEERLGIPVDAPKANKSIAEPLSLPPTTLRRLLDAREAEFALYDQVESGLLCEGPPGLRPGTPQFD